MFVQYVRNKVCTCNATNACIYFWFEMLNKKVFTCNLSYILIGKSSSYRDLHILTSVCLGYMYIWRVIYIFVYFEFFNEKVHIQLHCLSCFVVNTRLIDTVIFYFADNAITYEMRNFNCLLESALRNMKK